MEQNNWQPLTEWETLYLIDFFGNIKSLRLNIILSKYKSNCGYLRVGLRRVGGKKEMKSIHRLVGLNFIPNPENLPCINHEDGNKENNFKDNLKWCTYSYNTKHAFETGLTKMGIGEENPYAKLKDKDIPVIRQLANSLTHLQIGEKFGVDRKTISCIIHHKTWSHI